MNDTTSQPSPLLSLLPTAYLPFSIARNLRRNEYTSFACSYLLYGSCAPSRRLGLEPFGFLMLVIDVFDDFGLVEPVDDLILTFWDVYLASQASAIIYARRP